MIPPAISHRYKPRKTLPVRALPTYQVMNPIEEAIWIKGSTDGVFVVEVEGDRDA